MNKSGTLETLMGTGNILLHFIHNMRIIVLLYSVNKEVHLKTSTFYIGGTKTSFVLIL